MNNNKITKHFHIENIDIMRFNTIGQIRKLVNREEFLDEYELEWYGDDSIDVDVSHRRLETDEEFAIRFNEEQVKEAKEAPIKWAKQYQDYLSLREIFEPDEERLVKSKEK